MLRSHKCGGPTGEQVERFSQDYKTGRKEFSGALKLGLTSMLQNMMILGSVTQERAWAGRNHAKKMIPDARIMPLWF